MSEFTLYANNSSEIKNIKESLLEKGLEIKHVFTSSSTPTLHQRNGYAVAANLGDLYRFRDRFE